MSRISESLNLSEESEVDCKCVKIIGHLEDVNWLLWARKFLASPGPLALGDWVKNPYIWLHHVESNEGELAKDDSLKCPDSRYWSIHDVQRYFVGDFHCEKALFTYQYPNLRMSTRLGSYFWKSNASLKKPDHQYSKELYCSIATTLMKLETTQAQMDRLIISDQLIHLERMDYFRRKSFMRILLNILSFQDRLQLVSFENLLCKRLEGVRLIQQLATFNAGTLKYLFLWRFVLPNENPILINYSYITGSGQYIPRPASAHCFLRSLAALTNLRVLALEYAHLADSTGAALVTILPVLKRPHFRLQLICREGAIPGRADASLGVGGHVIPDTAWRRVAIACPDLYLLMAFCCVRDYDNVRRFLSRSVPLREIHVELGVDLLRAQRQDSDVSCVVRHVAHAFGNALVTLSLHQWRFAVFPLCRVFELMPHLTRFLYVGRVADEVDLHRMLGILACGVADKLKQVKIQIQDEEPRRKYWKSCVQSLTREYAHVMKLYNIDLCLNIYKI